MLGSKLQELSRRSGAADGFKIVLISTIIYSLVRIVGATLRLKTYGEERIEATRKEYGGVILATWHGRTMIPTLHFRGMGLWAFISTSRDGNYQNRIFHKLGWNTVRGSTSARGAVASALRMAKELRSGAILAHTPDGPRGPSHVVHPGAIFLAEKSGCPIIPAGIAANPCRTMGAWDKYIVPKLFARAVIVYGEAMFVPPDVTHEQRHEFCLRLGNEITRLEAEADMLVGKAGAASANAAQANPL